MPADTPPYPGFFQVAYVTRDIDRAQAQFAGTHGIARFLEMRDIRYPTGPGREAHCHVSLAYVGATEIEIIRGGTPVSSERPSRPVTTSREQAARLMVTPMFSPGP